VKVAPVSADLLIKLALGAALIGAGVWAVRRATAAASDAAGKFWDTATDSARGLADSVTPWNNENVIYRAANAATGGTPDVPLGVRLWEWTHSEPDYTATPPRANTGGATGSWSEPLPDLVDYRYF
jgi:hypothetical protein